MMLERIQLDNQTNYGEREREREREKKKKE